MSPLRIQLDRIRRRAWLVLTVTVLAVLGAAAASLGQETTFTGRSTLTIISPDRAPEQDAPLAQGYAEYFNEPSYQGVLAGKAGVPPTVTFIARTAATSPIVYVEATASSAEAASSAAAAMSTAFLDDVNANLRADRDSAIAELQRQVTEERALLATLAEDSPEASLSTQAVLNLQDRVSSIQSDTSNQLQELQLSAGVSTSAPKPVQNIALGLVGGLILGCMLALGFAAVENRLATSDEVRDQLGLDTLAVVPGGRSRATERTRQQRLKQLANRVSLSDLARPATVVIISPRATVGVAHVAEALAYYRAVQGERTLLMHADLHRWGRSDPRGNPGVADFLAAPYGVGVQGRVLPGACPTMQVMPAGSSRDDPYALFARDRFADLVGHASAITDLVVIEAPPIVDAAEGQVICATADRTILVVEEEATRAADAVEACQLLEQVEATLLGVVITSPRSRRTPAAFPLASGTVASGARAGSETDVAPPTAPAAAQAGDARNGA
ncbi:MAG: hypothetical protein GEU83_02330 [Pseudonocardiaceae bacterium]|nr:hypothetical protein [Pseudonocardiaceae bacterium]